MPPKTFKPPLVAPQMATQVKVAAPPLTNRNREVTNRHRGIAERIKVRGEYLSANIPQKGLANALSNELKLQAAAAERMDIPESVRYGTNWKPMVPDVRIIKNSPEIITHSVVERTA